MDTLNVVEIQTFCLHNLVYILVASMTGVKHDVHTQTQSTLTAPMPNTLYKQNQI